MTSQYLGRRTIQVFALYQSLWRRKRLRVYKAILQTSRRTLINWLKVCIWLKMEGKYCRACKHLLRRKSQTPEKKKFWHEDVFSLKAAAEEGTPEDKCRLCRLVWLNLTAKEKAQTRAEGNWPIDESLLATGEKPITTSFCSTGGLQEVSFYFPLLKFATADRRYMSMEYGILTKNLTVDSTESK